MCNWNFTWLEHSENVKESNSTSTCDGPASPNTMCQMSVAVVHVFSRKLRERVLLKNSCSIDHQHDKTIADHQPLTTANDKTIADHQPLTTANDNPWPQQMIRQWEDLLRRSAEKICWENLLRRSAEKICWENLLRRSAEKICWEKICWEDLLRRSAEKICWEDLLRKSAERKSAEKICWEHLLKKICCEDLLRRSAEKICWKNLLRKSAEKILLRMVVDQDFFKISFFPKAPRKGPSKELMQYRPPTW